MLLGNVKFRELDTIYILLICLVLIETTCLVSVLVFIGKYILPCYPLLVED